MAGVRADASAHHSRADAVDPSDRPDNTAADHSLGPTTSPPTTTLGTRRGTSFAITGRATAGGAPVAGVVVVFKLATAPTNCQTCDAYSATTGPDGRYALNIPEGQYVGGCALTGYTCVFAVAPDDRYITLSLTSAWTGDVLIEAGPATSPPGPATSPAGPATSPAPGGDQPDLSGHVYDGNGRPVPGVAIEVEMNDLNQHAYTDDAGYYEIDRIQIVGTVVCAAIGSCLPQGLTPPITINPGDPPRVINWTIG